MEEDIMKKYYVQNGKIVINKYSVKYEYIINNPNSETKASVLQYAADDTELSGLENELKEKGIKYTVTELETDDIMKFNGTEIETEEEARRIVEPTIEEVKEDKIKEISDACRETIFEGIDVKLSNENVKHFSLKTEDQININNLLEQVSIGNIKAENGIPYHADGEMCILFSVQDFTLIANEAANFILKQTTYCNHLMAYIRSLENIKEISDITYGQELTGEFLENYNHIIGKTDYNN